MEEALKADFPVDVKEWNMDHIVQWLDTLMLGQYRKAFEEAAIDGPFLLELTDAVRQSLCKLYAWEYILLAHVCVVGLCVLVVVILTYRTCATCWGSHTNCTERKSCFPGTSSCH